MNMDDFLFGKDFILFQDETLRNHACQAVDHFLKEFDPVDKAQLYSIPSQIQAGGIAALKRLMDNQIQKNTNAKNNKFWVYISDLLFATPEPEFSLRGCISNELERCHCLVDENSTKEKAETKRLRKVNKARIEKAMNQTLPIYFEHFNCHYFYRTG